MTRKQIKKSHKRPCVILAGFNLWQVMGNLLASIPLCFKVSRMPHIHHIFATPKKKNVADNHNKAIPFTVSRTFLGWHPSKLGWAMLHICLLPCLHVALSAIKTVLPESAKEVVRKGEMVVKCVL